MRRKSKRRKKGGADNKILTKSVPLHTSVFEEIMGEVDMAFGKKKNPPGRPTVRPNILSGRRDDIAQLLETEWYSVGWQLQCLRNPGEQRRSPEDVRIALEPLRGKHGHERIVFLLRPTSLPATSDDVRSTLVELGKAREKLNLVRSAHQEQATNFKDIWRALYETSKKYREELKAEITRRIGNVVQLRNDCIDKETPKKRSLHDQDQVKAEAKLQTAQAQIEKCEVSLRLEEEIIRGLKERLSMATNENRSLVWEMAKTRLHQLREEKTHLQHRTGEVRRLEKLYEDQSAGFARQDFLTFSVERRGRHHPRQLANAIAGLPEMGCRQSFTTCRKMSFQRDPHTNFKVFEVIARAWQKRDTHNPQKVSELVDGEINRLPKTRLFNGERVPNYFRESLQNKQPILEKAIESCWNVEPRPHPSEVPYIITAMFLENESKQVSTLARVLSQSTRAKNNAGPRARSNSVASKKR